MFLPAQPDCSPALQGASKHVAAVRRTAGIPACLASPNPGRAGGSTTHAGKFTCLAGRIKIRSGHPPSRPFHRRNRGSSLRTAGIPACPLSQDANSGRTALYTSDYRTCLSSLIVAHSPITSTFSQGYGKTRLREVLLRSRWQRNGRSIRTVMNIGGGRPLWRP